MYHWKGFDVRFSFIDDVVESRLNQIGHLHPETQEHVANCQQPADRGLDAVEGMGQSGTTVMVCWYRHQGETTGSAGE
jgi:hypothetical protein